MDAKSTSAALVQTLRKMFNGQSKVLGYSAVTVAYVVRKLKLLVDCSVHVLPNRRRQQSNTGK